MPNGHEHDEAFGGTPKHKGLPDELARSAEEIAAIQLQWLTGAGQWSFGEFVPGDLLTLFDSFRNNEKTTVLSYNGEACAILLDRAGTPVLKTIIEAITDFVLFGKEAKKPLTYEFHDGTWRPVKRFLIVRRYIGPHASIGPIKGLRGIPGNIGMPDYQKGSEVLLATYDTDEEVDIFFEAIGYFDKKNIGDAVTYYVYDNGAPEEPEAEPIIEEYGNAER